ncbi:type I restriction endonuclease subunit R [Sulfurimonas autotrophica]|uniref:Type III restriction protein res subunit n=1 Tax=Sulfurimonas autotrophica (strain ATCC BAA-671 / DSM 16294 / JCM 11897 / OK10) TaxID=563040 RepID=E0UTB7_SULAO|nr:DEAD/DEAH box helicase family protein [Sulfurimonas autotrophica]ADN08220.1 type III restriction protein res subunit [Sulfurimonas autotrophica DSM 16294]
MSKHKERQFQIEIVEHLKANKYVEGDATHYDRELALYPSDLINYIKSTQPQAYEKMQKREGSKTDEVLCKHVAKEMDKHGSLHYLRNDLKYIGSKFKLCQFKPELHNPDTQAKYDANILRVVQEVTTKSGNERIDLVLFLNGIPIVTCELKTDFTQNVQDAVNQYKYERPAKGEALLEFKRRALVHFAVSNDEVYMTTKLAGDKTFFLPFNKGQLDGSAGNPPNPNGYATSYLWEEVLQRDSILNIIARYIHLEVKTKEDHQGKKSKSETLIFPRYHQLDVVRKLLADTREKGAGNHYLIQHSAGSGKSNSIAWLSHQLSSLHNDQEESVFSSVIVITDRTVLDNQLQETISSFEHKDGVVVGISRDGSNESKSAQLADALERGAKIIITTIQTFPFVLKAIQKRTSLKNNSYAIIADEAHSSQTGSTAKQLREVLTAEQIEEGVELSAEDIITASIESRSASTNLSFYAFTATPKTKTLEMFGVLPKPDEAPSETNKPQAFHLYTMKQAIQEGFILDVLQGYTTYKLFYKLEHANMKHDQEVESKRAKVKVAKWLNIHPHNIAQKIEIICEHFKTTVAPLLDGQAKAMVVTSSRNAAVRYKLAFDKYIQEHDIEKMQAMVAFSGKIEDDIEGTTKEYTETSMNPNLKGREMRKAFDSNDYQVMLVANKFQTGFDQPKLCAMYVDKKLGGVDCVQTLSRLNRTYAGKEQTFILDFYNEAEDIKEAFEPYYNTTEIEDVTDPNIVYDMQHKLDESDIFTTMDVENYAKAFFNPKGTQAAMSSAVKPAVDRYKNRYKLALENINSVKVNLAEAKKNKDDAGIHNYELDLKVANEDKNALDIFKKDLISFLRMYEFLSQIVDYADEDLLKLSAFVKALIPNLKTYDPKDPIDISEVQLSHYKLHKQKNQNIDLVGDEVELGAIGEVGSAVAKDPEKELLSAVLGHMNALFEGNLTDEDMINYANTIKDKVLENDKVVEQVTNNTKEQAMMGGFADAINSAVIDSLEVHQDLATQVLGKDRIRAGFADIVYELIAKGLKAS